MAVITKGSRAPAIPGVEFGGKPRVIFFYKVTCPVCQMSAPHVERFQQAYPGAITGVGEDPPAQLADFAREHGMSFGNVPDEVPFTVSDAYGLEAVPTLVLVGADGMVADTVESWDREGFNRVSSELSEMLGLPYAPISEEGDGLPPFRPG